MARFRIFFDMDGVLVDFDAYVRALNEERPGSATPDTVKRLQGAYLAMPPIAGALDGIRKVMSIAGQYGGEVWLATKPPTGIPWAYADKVSWVLEHLPELKRRIIITHDKGLLGGEGDYLVDDRPWRANCGEFRGTLVHFAAGDSDGLHPAAYCGADTWPDLVEILHELMRARPDASRQPPDTRGRCARVGAPCECAPEAKEGCVSWRPYRGEAPEPTLDDINAARGLLRLGPLPETDWVLRDGQTVIARGFDRYDLEQPGYLPLRYLTHEQVLDALRQRNGRPAPPVRLGDETVSPIATRPVHGGYPGAATIGPTIPDHPG